MLAGLFAAALAFAGSASAHATVVGSDPSDGQRLAAVPTQVTITFDEPVTLGDLGYLHVTNASGARVDSGAAFHPAGDEAKIAAALRPGLPDGVYTESFRVISADSHPVAGSIAFVVGSGPAPLAPSGPGASNGPVTAEATAALFTAVRWVSYTGLALLGGLWLLATVWPAGRSVRRARAAVWSGWALAAAGAVAELWLQGPYAAGDGLGGLGNFSLLDDTLHTTYGQFHSARLVLLGVLAALLAHVLRPAAGRDAGRPERSGAGAAGMALAVLAGVGLTFSLIGHPDTTDPRWLSIAADLVHLCSMAAWLGGLTMLLAVVLPRRDPEELRCVLPTVSRVSFCSVVALAVTGTYAAWRGIGSWGAIVGTDYGLLVCAKVLLFCGLIALGNLSRGVVQRRLVAAREPAVVHATSAPVPATGGPGPVADGPGPVADGGSPPGLTPLEHERMRRAVIVEVALAALVLAATAVLVDQPRGAEALAAANRRPVTAGAPLGSGRSATVTIDPGVHGRVSVGVALGPGPRPESITATALQPRRQLGPIPIPLRAAGSNRYTASGVDLPASGTWVITVVVTDSVFDAVTTDARIELH